VSFKGPGPGEPEDQPDQLEVEIMRSRSSIERPASDLYAGKLVTSLTTVTEKFWVHRHGDVRLINRDFDKFDERPLVFSL
jgi:hypothetical protein